MNRAGPANGRAGGKNTKVGEGAGAPEAGKRIKENMRQDSKRKILLKKIN